MKNCSTLNLNSIKVLSLLFCLLTFAAAQAATVTWDDSDGNWDDPNSWDTGTVPTANDVVIIPSGNVEIIYGTTAFAKRIEIGSNANLKVRDNAKLVLEEAEMAAAIINEGTLIIYGKIEIKDVTLHPSSSNQAYGIHNLGNMIVRNTGKIEVRDIHYHGIQNDGFLTSYGEILVEHVGSSGIRNYGNFKNYNIMNLIVPRLGTSHTYGLQNTGTFINYSNGQIDISDGSNGVLNWQAGLFYNYGSILAKAIQYGALSNEYRFYNRPSGFINLEGGASGLKNKDRFYNQGELKIRSVSGKGVINEDRFYNYKLLEITNSEEGIKNTDLVRNWGTIRIENSTFNSIVTDGGHFNNYAEAQLIVDKRIFFLNNSEFNNTGFIVSNWPSVNALNTTATNAYNNGVINTPFGSANSNYNEELFMSSINTPLQNGVPYPNALELVDHDHVEFRGVFNDVNKSKEVAEYDSKNNLLIPGDEAIGLTALYFELALDGGDNVMMCRLTLASPVLPMVINNPNGNPITGISELQELTVFPNPSRGDFELSGELFNEAATEISLYNTLGQLMLKKEFAAFEQLRLTFPVGATNGMYFLRVRQNGKMVAEERLQLLR